MKNLGLFIQEFRDKLPENIYKEIESYLEHDEWGLALEELCNFLYEYEVQLKMSEYEKIIQFCKRMRMDESSFDFLKQLIV